MTTSPRKKPPGNGPANAARAGASATKSGRQSGKDTGKDTSKRQAGKEGRSLLARFAGLIRLTIRLAIALALLVGAVWAGLLIHGAFGKPVSSLMLGRWITFQSVDRRWTPLERISPNVIAAVIISEDARFCRHHGIDWGSLEEQLTSEDGPSRGASTISMQTVKNVMLWPQRSYIRKGLEIPLALAMDAAWSKRRVLEVYLNIAEWGDGIFGVEAAARHYFRKSARRLTRREAALLATALPNPFIRNPARPRRHHLNLVRINMARARKAGPWLTCLKD